MGFLHISRYMEFAQYLCFQTFLCDFNPYFEAKDSSTQGMLSP